MLPECEEAELALPLGRLGLLLSCRIQVSYDAHWLMDDCKHPAGKEHLQGGKGASTLAAHAWGFVSQLWSQVNTLPATLYRLY